MIYIALVLLILCKPCLSVKDCTVILKNPKLNSKKAVCDMPHTKMEQIPNDLPDTVTELEISFQNLKVLNHKEFVHLPNLEFLSITSSNVEIIEEGAFLMLSKLHTLILANNSITISNVGDTKLSSSIFLPLLNLRNLDLSYNYVKEVPGYFFVHINNTLEELDLSYSKSEIQLQKASLSFLGSLKKLRLEFDNISTLIPDIESSLNSMTHLNEISLFGNPWMCNCKLRWLVVWIVKKIRSNREFSINQSPLCYSPKTMKHRPLFRKSFKFADSEDFRCNPEVNTLNSTITTVVGQNVSLACIFNNLEETQEILWLRKNLILTRKDVNDRLFIIESNGDIRKSILTIHFVTENDAGNWRCLVKDKNKVIGAEYRIYVDTDPSNLRSAGRTSPVVYTAVTISVCVLFFVALTILVYYFKYYDRIFLTNNRKNFGIISFVNSRRRLCKTKKNHLKVNKIVDEKIYDDVPIVVDFRKKKVEQRLNCMSCRNYEIGLKFGDAERLEQPRLWYLDDSNDDCISTVEKEENDVDTLDRAVITRVPSHTPCPIHSRDVSFKNRTIPDINRDILETVQINSCPLHGNKSSVRFSIPYSDDSESSCNPISQPMPENSFQDPKSLCRHLSFKNVAKNISENRQYCCLTNSLV